jgi:hypothetical protein
LSGTGEPTRMGTTAMDAEPSICHYQDKTCGRCCWGSRVTRARLVRQLRIQRSQFEKRFPQAAAAGRLRLIVHEVRVRRGADLFFAPLLVLPVLATRLRLAFRERTICAFLAFTDESEARIGCLLHPTRRRGSDIRQRVAFGCLPGLGCGPADHLCEGALRFASAPRAVREEFAREGAARDWYVYSMNAPRFR